jgi:phage-related protein
MATLVLQNRITQTSSKTYKFNTIIANYGDGYMQRAGDGINKKRESWALIYDNLTQTERDTLATFIDSVGMNDTIEWTAPGDATEKKWIIDPESEIMEVAKTGDIYSISFTVKRVFDL